MEEQVLKDDLESGFGHSTWNRQTREVRERQGAERGNPVQATRLCSVACSRPSFACLAWFAVPAVGRSLCHAAGAAASHGCLSARGLLGAAADSKIKTATDLYRASVIVCGHPWSELCHHFRAGVLNGRKPRALPWAILFRAFSPPGRRVTACITRDSPWRTHFVHLAREFHYTVTPRGSVASSVSSA